MRSLPNPPGQGPSHIWHHARFSKRWGKDSWGQGVPVGLFNPATPAGIEPATQSLGNSCSIP